MREIKSLRVMGEWIYEPNLWHINRESTSVAFATGLFVAFLPLPIQMVTACLIALRLRCNLPLAVTLCWVTNPFTAGPVFWFAYEVGALILDVPPQTEPFSISWEWVVSGLVTIWQPLLLGCLVCGFFFASLGYFTINALWRWDVVRRWDARSASRGATPRRAAAPRPDAPDTGRPESTETGPPR